MQELPKEALEELKDVLTAEYGEEELSAFSDEMINELGLTLLKMAASCIKARIQD